MATVAAEYVNQIGALAFDLYRVLKADSDGNIVFSPLGISTAFSMVYAGAAGETEQEMADSLRFGPQGSHHVANQQFVELMQPKETFLKRILPNLPDDEPESGFRLAIANGVWANPEIEIKRAYAQTLKTYYDTKIRTADFVQKANEIGEEIQSWVDRETQGFIPNFRPSILPDLVMMLINVIHFKDRWIDPFNEYATRPLPFKGLNDSKLEAQMMHTDLEAPYMRAEGQFQAVNLRYESTRSAEGMGFSMMVIVPDEGMFEQVENRLSAEFFQLIRETVRVRDLDLALPKFTEEVDLNLLELLPQLGLSAVFDSRKCDLSGISDTAGLFVSDAKQKAKIAVDENGTEAAAVTSIGIALSAAPEEVEKIRFHIDRPFIYAIQDQASGLILFLGRVTEPNA